MVFTTTHYQTRVSPRRAEKAPAHAPTTRKPYLFATSPTQHPSLTPVFLASPRHSQSKSRRARLHAAILMSGTQDKFAPKVLCRIAKSHHPAVVAAVKVVARIATGFISADDN